MQYVRIDISAVNVDILALVFIICTLCVGVFYTYSLIQKHGKNVSKDFGCSKNNPKQEILWDRQEVEKHRMFTQKIYKNYRKLIELGRAHRKERERESVRGE